MGMILTNIQKRTRTCHAQQWPTPSKLSWESNLQKSVAMKMMDSSPMLKETSMMIGTLAACNGLPILGRHRPVKDYFHGANRTALPTTAFPYCTFSIISTAFHLSCDPAFRMTPEAVADMFSIPDLIPALSHSLHHLTQSNDSVYPIGGRRYGMPQVVFPFENLEVWTGLGCNQEITTTPTCWEWAIAMHGRYESLCQTTSQTMYVYKLIVL